MHEIHLNYENQQNTMKVFTRQEANLESSKGFDGSIKSHLTVLKIHARKSDENLSKSRGSHEKTLETNKQSMKYDESPQRTKPTWNRAHVSIDATGHIAPM